MNSKGSMGEDIACKYLINNDYEIVKRNYRSPYGEIDIIAHKNMHLSFIEVKTWDVYDFSDIEYSVNKKKQNNIVKTSKYYLMNNEKYSDYNCSYDVLFIEYSRKKIKHLISAFMENSLD